MKYCIVLAQEGCMMRTRKAYEDSLPDQSTLEYWEEYHTEYGGSPWVVINVFPIAEEE